MNDTVSTGRIPENSRLRLVFSLGIFLVEMTSFMFLPKYREIKAIFYLLNMSVDSPYLNMGTEVQI